MEKKNFRATGSDRELHKTKKVTFSSDIKGKKKFFKNEQRFAHKSQICSFLGCF